MGADDRRGTEMRGGGGGRCVEGEGLQCVVPCADIEPSLSFSTGYVVGGGGSFFTFRFHQDTTNSRDMELRLPAPQTPVSYTHLRPPEQARNLVFRPLPDK